jgi:polysaccharide export outer membrane protein
VAGKTPAEIAAWLEDAYVSRLLLRDPHVTVLVTEYATQGVAVMGEVMKPGTYPLLGPHTIVDLLSAAGGLTQAAGETASIAHQDGTTQEIVLDTNNPRHTIAVDVPVRPGDRIVVSRAAVVYVVGDVGKPGGFTMQNNGKLSVLQAIALASGANKTADLGKARILHKTEAGYEERQVALNRLLRSDLPDETLAPNDILFVPNSKLKSAIANGFSTAVQAAAMASIYRR